TAMGIVAVAALAGCDSLLEVDLPDAVTESALELPSTAGTQVNSVMAAFECSYSGFTLNAAGYEDNFQRTSGVAGVYSEYADTPTSGECDSGAGYSSTWIDGLLISRAEGSKIYDRITNWTVAEVPNREKYLAQTALYVGLTLDVLGEHFCEMTVDSGPLMTPEETLTLAETWVNTALEHIQVTGDYALDVTSGRIAPSIEQMAYGARARIRWAKGDLAGAAEDAARVNNNFVAYVLREEGEDRRNTVAVFASPAQQAAGFLQGPVKIFQSGSEHGISALGNNPVTGQPWPNPVPFTGYHNLAIESSTGRAVTADGYPITTSAAGTV